MTIEYQIILVLSVLILALFFLWRRATSRLQEVAFHKSSLSSRYGKMTEQFMPFLKNYPYLPENFRFLGSPIDGVQFEDDKIIFVEFKTANANLTEKQKRIAELTWQKKVEFKEIRLD
ncbi:MAG: endonuclease [Patescibacteria group bacterium]|nr:endonuclease [Patescibacteria group bacterium]